MQLDTLTPAHVRQALGLYLKLAWPEDCEGRPRLRPEDLEQAVTLQDLRPFFESPRSHEQVTGRRYTMRLGNHRYPFMKFVVQEYLLAGEFFFSVDTHDELSITPEMPDYEEWQEVRALNAALKRRIEAVWAAAGLPTHESLRQLMEASAEVQRAQLREGHAGAALAPQMAEQADSGTQRRPARLLLVDDERDVARGLGAVLDARGYEVVLAFDGAQVLEALAQDPLPDLVLLDFSMPGLTGEQVIERMRADPRTRPVPVVLATATRIDPVGMGGANALLRKPYPQELLFRLIEDQLG